MLYLQQDTRLQACAASRAGRLLLCTYPHENEGQLERVGHTLARLLRTMDSEKSNV